MTEEEAKTKLCCGPKALVTPLFVAAGKQQTDPTGPLYCVGSACMAWRWEAEADFDQRYTEWDDAGNIAGVQRGPEPTRRGHCGLAGKP